MDVITLINGALRGLFGNLCEVIYPLIGSLYEFFIKLGTLAYNEEFVTIYNKISLIIGVFMVFRLTFWLIELLLNPDGIKDKEKNPGNIIKKVLIAVVLLAVTPTIFEYAFEIQSKIINSNMIENIVSIDKKTDATQIGRYLSAELFMNFYTPTKLQDGYEVSTDCTETYTGNGIIYDDLLNNGKMSELTNSCLTKRVNDSKEEPYEIDFNGLFAVGVGGFVAWMMLMYCISLATRYIQLIYLQIIAPIPIMCYLAPGKDNMFKKWVKQCTTTYLDLFIRVAIINFVMVLCKMILNNESGLMSTLQNEHWLIEVFLILGLLTFAKKAPQLISELIPTSSSKAAGDFGLSWKKRTDNMFGGNFLYNTGRKAIGFSAAALAGGALKLGVRAYDAHKYNQREDEKLDKYKQQRRDALIAARNKVEQKAIDNNFTAAKKKRALAGFDKRISDLDKMSRKDLRRDLSTKNAFMQRVLNSTDDSAKRAKIMENINANRESGMGHRNQILTAATSIMGATVNAGNVALKGKKFTEIFSQTMKNNVQSINKEQEWYRSGGSSDFRDIVKRTVSSVQRTFGIETEGQAVQYIIDGYKEEIKEKEEELTEAKDTANGHSSVRKDLKNAKSEGTTDAIQKGKELTVVDQNGQKSKISFKSRIGSARTSLDRVTEYHKNMTAQELSEKISSSDRKSDRYQNLKRLAFDRIVNLEQDPTERNRLAREFNAIIDDPNITYAAAYDKIMNMCRNATDKAEGDFGRLQEAASLLTSQMREKGIALDDSYYSSDTINISLNSMLKEISLYPRRYSNEIIDLKNKIMSFSEGMTEQDYTESNISELQKLIKKLEDKMETAEGEKQQIVAQIGEQVQSKKEEASAFERYVVTEDSLRNDKFNSGK